jgi:Pyruvate/2-oxoacid:ferredoxin oxidoreductase delta subunit/DNA-binding MarR family transcriptional regulator
MPEKTPCEQLAEHIGAGDSKIIPKIFEALLDQNEARLLLAAAPPATLEELSARTGIDATTIETMIEPLFRRGLLFKSRKPDGVRYYRVRHVLQFHDATAVATNPPRRMLDLWKEYMASEWNSHANKLESILPQPVVRVIPINVSIEPNSQVLAFEDVTNLINNARSLAVTKCSCRVIDGACGHALDVCLQLDRAADYGIERGTGRELSKEEAVRILEQCEADGLVHVSENRKSVGQVICNCCNDCCINWAPIRTRSGKFVAPSRYQAVVHADDCNGCELCVDRCFFDAIKMVDEGTLAAVDEEQCMGCGVCHVVCAPDAIRLEVKRAEEFVPA